jgi:hypothetical protein
LEIHRAEIKALSKDTSVGRFLWGWPISAAVVAYGHWHIPKPLIKKELCCGKVIAFSYKGG